MYTYPWHTGVGRGASGSSEMRSHWAAVPPATPWSVHCRAGNRSSPPCMWSGVRVAGLASPNSGDAMCSVGSGWPEKAGDFVKARASRPLKLAKK